MADYVGDSEDLLQRISFCFGFNGKSRWLFTNFLFDIVDTEIGVMVLELTLKYKHSFIWWT